MKFLKTLQPRHQAYLIILVVIALNLLSFLFFFRIDLTRSELYTLSDATKKLVGTLDDKVTVNVYFTDNLPAPYSTNRRFIQDQLEELRSYSDGKLNFLMVDPAGSDQLEKQVEQAGIPALQIQVVDNDKMEAKKAYMGIEILYENKKETLPVVQKPENFEFDFSTALNRMVRKKLPVLYTSADFGMPGWSGKQGVEQYLSKQYELSAVSVKDSAGIPDSVKSLVLFTPSEQLSELAKNNLFRFLDRGGRLAVFADRVSVNPQTQQAVALKNGLDSLFLRYGLTVSDNLVQDLQCASINVPQQVGMFQFNSQVEFPFLPVISDVNPDHELSSGISVVTPIFASAITLDSVAARLGAVPVLSTSSKSRISTGFYLLDPYQKWDEADFNQAALPVAVALAADFGGKGTPGRLFLMTDGELVNDDYVQGGSGVPFFINVMYWISDDEDLLAIPSKRNFMVPLPELSPATRQAVKYTNLLLPPAVVLVWGLYRWRKRRKLSQS